MINSFLTEYWDLQQICQTYASKSYKLHLLVKKLFYYHHDYLKYTVYNFKANITLNTFLLSLEKHNVTLFKILKCMSSINEIQFSGLIFKTILYL